MSAMTSRLAEAVKAVEPVNQDLAAAAQARLDDLTKPRGSLGRLEELAARLYLIQEKPPLSAEPIRMVVAAGDHGVAAQGVSAYPQDVTRQMVLNFLAGGAGINVLSKTVGAQIQVVDVGVAGPDFDEHPLMVRAKVAPGTKDMSLGPAMAPEECVQALELGLDLAGRAAREGVKCLGTGEMGIGNTTPATALFCAYLGLFAREITGPGAGLAESRISHKVEVVQKALAANRRVVEDGDPVAVLAALGGLEIACLAGMVIGGALNRLAVCVDGFISTAAYVAALNICPAVKGYCFLSHASAEPGYERVMRQLDETPLLHLGFRLGEGTGAALAAFLLKAAANMFNDMATFSSANVSGASA